MFVASPGLLDRIAGTSGGGALSSGGGESEVFSVGGEGTVAHPRSADIQQNHHVDEAFTFTIAGRSYLGALPDEWQEIKLLLSAILRTSP